MKRQRKQQIEARHPRQERARQKVELMLEATVRLLEKGSIDTLTTNAVAAKAGVSIGTLYQYFPNKEAILDALADGETEALAGRVMAVVHDDGIITQEQRIAAVVSAVAAAFGNRRAAHRQVMAHSLSRSSNRIGALLSGLRSHLAHQRSVGAHTDPLHAADAFVLTHAFAGVLRAMTSEGEKAPPQREIEQALARLVARFLEG